MLLERAQEYIRQNNLNAYSAAEISGSGLRKKVFRKCHDLNNIYSVSKSVTATAAGILISRGELRLSDPILKYLEKYLPEKYDDKLKEATVFNLFTHSLGHERGYMFEEDRYEITTNDWPRYILSKPLHYKPGEKMVYTNSAFYLLSLIIEELAGKPAFDFTRENLFLPLGIKGYAAEPCPAGHTFGASSYFLTAEGMAKIGWLYLSEGVWRGERILSPYFIEKAFSPLFKDGNRFYGLSFWMNSETPDYFYGDGKFGQLLLMDPINKEALSVKMHDDVDMKAFSSFIAGR